MVMAKTTCGQTYGLRGWWGSEPGDRQLNCRAGSILDIRATKLHDDKQIFLTIVYNKLKKIGIRVLAWFTRVRY